jgi:hypothetical protein
MAGDKGVPENVPVPFGFFDAISFYGFHSGRMSHRDRLSEEGFPGRLVEADFVGRKNAASFRKRHWERRNRRKSLLRSI